MEEFRAMILAGDIGGTNARLAFYESENGKLQQVSERIFPSRQFREFDDIVSQFLKDSKIHPDLACFGIAGPVREGRVATSNLPWTIDQARLAEQNDVSSVLLINDLEATAWGIGALGPQDFTSLHSGAGTEGNQAVIAPGTGLGEAGLYWDGKQHHVFACEGGHADFAPQGALQIELLQFLSRSFEHVSYERVLSGPGLVNVYDFLLEKQEGAGSSSGQTAAAGDRAAAISQAAMNGSDSVAEAALDLWISVYGAEVGNWALKAMATGGIFLGGGISPKILPKLTGSTFINAFLQKGRLRPLVESIPVKVITNDKAGLLGAARCAAVRGSAVLQGAA
jgi:glucokinase